MVIRRDGRRRGRHARRHAGGANATRRLNAVGGVDAAEAGNPPPTNDADGRRPGGDPPKPPLALTPRVACDPDTDEDILWHIARQAPELRRWLIANPAASAELLEYVSQAGGPGVARAFRVLFESMEALRRPPPGQARP